MAVPYPYTLYPPGPSTGVTAPRVPAFPILVLMGVGTTSISTSVKVAQVFDTFAGPVSVGGRRETCRRSRSDTPAGASPDVGGDASPRSHDDR